MPEAPQPAIVNSDSEPAGQALGLIRGRRRPTGPAYAGLSSRRENTEAGLRTTDFTLRVMPASMAAKLAIREDPLGFAQRCPDNERGCVANILYPKVNELASQRGARVAGVLGHAIAHEVGHLLLGPNAHSSSGVMRGVWSPEDLKLMNWSFLFFTARQSSQLRASLVRRTELELRPNLKSVSSK